MLHVVKCLATRKRTQHLPNVGGSVGPFARSSTSLEKSQQNSENKPRGLYFSKTSFEGLIFGGAYLEGLVYGGKFAFQNRLG